MTVSPSSPRARRPRLAPTLGWPPRAPAGALLAGLALALLLVSCSTQRRYESPQPGFVERGLASWYGSQFHGRATASGETYDMHAMTAAHKELPLGTVVDVLNLDNGRSVRVRINDRGPFVRGRVIDLSYAAAQAMDMIGPGLARVEIRIAQVGNGRPGMSQVAGWAVQAGAFRDRDNALDLSLRLAQTYPETALRSDSGLHRVWVGEFTDRDEAERRRRELVRRGLQAVLVELH
jgi:peptidoglycan lytic transglycosylase